MHRNHFNYHGQSQDQGPELLVVNLQCATQNNTNFRTVLWTGQNLQLTLMCIPVGGDIGVELHEDVDQFIRIESGCALVKTGGSQDALPHQQRVDGNYALMIPAGTWHNIVNIGNAPLKLYSVYAPPKHPFGTIHRTQADARND